MGRVKRYFYIIIALVAAWILGMIFIPGCTIEDKNAVLKKVEEIIEEGKKYKVIYNENGNTGGIVPEDNNRYKEGETVTVLGNIGKLIKNNYLFNDWNTAPDGSGINYSAGNTFTMGTSNVTLYAQWVSVEKRDMVSVPGGTYTQEDTNGHSFTHTISAFEIGKYEVTYELWHTVYSWAINNGYHFANAGTEGSEGTAGAEPTTAKYEPVTYINWWDAIVWCNAYSEMAGYTPVYRNESGEVIKDSRDSNGAECDNAVPYWSTDGFRLPTEGEWQYAASYIDGLSWLPYNHASGDTSSYCYPSDAGSSTVFGNYAWYYDNSSGKTQEVGKKNANQLGIYDMSGNVYDWCWDWYGNWPTINQTDYKGPTSGSYRIRRGGCWYGDARYLRVGFRYFVEPYIEYGVIGIRVLRTP